MCFRILQRKFRFRAVFFRFRAGFVDSAGEIHYTVDRTMGVMYMNKKIKNFLGFLLAVLLVVALASAVESMVDMDSEYKQTIEELEALRFRMNQGMSIGMTRDELDKLTRPTGSLSYWVGVQKADYVPEGEDCGAEEWLPLVVRNNGCPDCDWFSVIAYPSDTEGERLGTELCPFCGKELWLLEAEKAGDGA